jgi:hypothetical protein
MLRNLPVSFGKPAAAALVGVLLLMAASARPEQGKLVRDASITFPVAPPIKVKAITASGRNITAGERFAAPDNWLDGLRVTVENVSGKRVEHVELQFMFAGPVPGRPPALVPVGYGKIPGLDHASSNPGPPLDRGGAATLALSTKSGLLGELFKQGGFRRQAVTMRLARVIFDDGTGWAHGRNTRRDAQNPLRWNVLEEKGAASSLASPTRELFSLVPASLRAGVAGKSSLGRQQQCYKWRNYDIIPCNECGDTLSSDNFDMCHWDYENCDYKPRNVSEWCGSSTECYNLQYRLETWLCEAWDDI